MAEYLDSNKIHIFPCSNRGSEIDYESKIMTEYNLTHVGSVIKNPANYTISYKNNYIEFVLGGYYVKANIGSRTGNFWVGCNVKDSEIVSGISTKALRNFEQDNFNLDINGKFYGIKFDTIDVGGDYSFQVLKDGELINSRIMDVEPASNNDIGGFKTGFTASGKNIPVQLNTDNRAYVDASGFASTTELGSEQSARISKDSDLEGKINNKSKVSVSSSGSSTTTVHYIKVDGTEYKLPESSGGTSNFNELSNRPKYKGNEMTGSTNIPEVKTVVWDAKSTVSGEYDDTNWKTITIDGTTKNIPQGGSGTSNFNELSNRPKYKGSEMTGSTNIPEVKTNVFSNIKVGDTTISADATNNTFELAAGSNVTLTPDSSNRKITIAASGGGGGKTYTGSYGIVVDNTNNKITGKLVSRATTYTIDLKLNAKTATATITNLDTFLKKVNYKDNIYTFTCVNDQQSTDLEFLLTPGNVQVLYWSMSDYGIDVGDINAWQVDESFTVDLKDDGMGMIPQFNSSTNEDDDNRGMAPGYTAGDGGKALCVNSSATGVEWKTVGGSSAGVTSFGGATGAIAVGTGLSMNGNTLNATGVTSLVTSLGKATGDIIVSNGLTMSGSSAGYNIKLNMNINGTTDLAATPTIYAPATSGTAGQILVSGGESKEPVWSTYNGYETVYKNSNGLEINNTNGVDIQSLISSYSSAYYGMYKIIWTPESQSENRISNEFMLKPYSEITTLYNKTAYSSSVSKSSSSNLIQYFLSCVDYRQVGSTETKTIHAYKYDSSTNKTTAISGYIYKILRMYV